MSRRRSTQRALQKGPLMADEKTDRLTEIKKRLREGKLRPDDLKELERVVLKVEEASKALRAALVE
jgi:hypothetical protein